VRQKGADSLHNKSVFILLCTPQSANITFAFAAERRATAQLLLIALAVGTQRGRPQLFINISCPQGAQWEIRCTMLLLAIDGTDR